MFLLQMQWGDPAVCKQKNLGALSFAGTALRPTSTGTVRLASTDPLQAPIVDPNYLSTENDRELSRKALKLIKRMIDHIREDGYPILEVEPLPDMQDDTAIDSFVKISASTCYHYTSTCRMAPESEGGVLDDRLRVHGVRGLRVADSSACPQIPATHPAAAAVMIAEKCSDMVKEDDGLL